MLYWICPECGHECSPAIRECPTCTALPASKHAAASQELLSLAQNFQSASSVALLAPPATVAPPVPHDEPEPELSHDLAPLDGLAARPARPRGSEPLKVIPTPVPARLFSPAFTQPAAFAITEFGLQPAGLASTGEISFQGAGAVQPKPLEQAAEPVPSRRQSVVFVRAALPVADHSGLAFAGLAEVDHKPLKPVLPHPNGQPQNDKQNAGVSTPLAYKSSEPSLVSSRLELNGESLAELLSVLKVSAEELDRAGIQAIEASFYEQPAMSLLSAAPEIVTAPAPPAAQWMRSHKPKFTPIPPEYAGRSTVMAGPQAPPLAGPCLPPQLLNFENSSLRGKRKRAASWPVSLLIATVVLLGAGSLYQFVTQNRDTKAASVSSPVEGAKVVATPRVRVAEEHPAARSVEVAGVRVVTGANKRPQLQYLVINHSSTELTGLNIRIAVRSVESSEDAPLFTVSSMIASLGPNQSKEVRADLDPSIAPAAIPDWHSLRTEVLVARQ